MNRFARGTIVPALFLALAVLSPDLQASGTGERETGRSPASEPAAAAAPGFPRTVRDDLGNEIVLKTKPVRIISGTLMTDEILLSLVEPSRIAALTAFASDKAVSNIAAEAARVPVHAPLNVELYVSLAPDLVFLADWSDASAVEQLRGAGITVYRVQTPVTLQGVEKTVTALAESVGEPEAGKEIVARMNDRLESVRTKVAPIPQDRRLTVMDYSTWGTAMGKNSTWDFIVRQAGLVNAVAYRMADEWGSVPVSKELLLELDPDILVLPGWVYGNPGGSDTFYSSVVNDPALRGMKAVRTDRVIRIPEAHRSSTSQYMVYAVEDLAKAAYPDLFR